MAARTSSLMGPRRCTTEIVFVCGHVRFAASGFSRRILKRCHRAGSLEQCIQLSLSFEPRLPQMISIGWASSGLRRGSDSMRARASYIAKAGVHLNAEAPLPCPLPCPLPWR